MKQTTSLQQKMKQLGYILLPILVTQVALFSMNFFDTVMSGHASAKDLAGVAIGASLWTPIFTGLNGILLALTPIVAHLVGAQNKEKVPYEVIQGIYLALVISVLVVLGGMAFLDPILHFMDLDAEVRRIAKGYLVALSLGIVPLFIYTVFRCFMDALGKTTITMCITLISLPINVGLNYVLIFGKWGFPRLGGVGAGYATSITYGIICLISLVVICQVKTFSEYRVFSRFYSPSFAAWKEQLSIGIPIGFSIFFETSIFAAVTLLMSEFETVTIAAHQAALNFASMLYMIPMSISMALTISVGFEVGAKRLKDASHYSYLGIGLAILMAMICAIGLVLFNHEVAALYSNDQAVIELTKHFLIYAIFFQLSDAIAAPIQGALRGYKDVNATFMMAFISYWLLGLPIGCLLVKYTSFGAFGYWVGLIAGLAFGAVFLLVRLFRIQQGPTLSSKLEP